MRETITAALQAATKAQAKRRVSTLRMVSAAIKDRDIAARTAGKEQATDAELLELFAKMIKQREESAKLYEEGNRSELATQERAEIEIIRDFMPKQLSDAEIRHVAKQVVDEIGASGLRDMGKSMNVLKERYAGQMDFSKASSIVKEILQ